MNALSAPLAASEPEKVSVDEASPDDPYAGADGERVRRWAQIVDRYVWDRHGPADAVVRLLADDEIRGAFAAVDQLQHAQHLLDQLRLRHQPVPVAPGEQRLVCAHDRIGWPCPDGAVLWEIDD